MRPTKKSWKKTIRNACYIVRRFMREIMTRLSDSLKRNLSTRSDTSFVIVWIRIESSWLRIHTFAALLHNILASLSCTTISALERQLPLQLILYALRFSEIIRLMCISYIYADFFFFWIRLIGLELSALRRGWACMIVVVSIVMCDGAMFTIGMRWSRWIIRKPRTIQEYAYNTHVYTRIWPY